MISFFFLFSWALGRLDLLSSRHFGVIGTGNYVGSSFSQYIRGELILTVYTRGAHSHSIYAGSSFSQYIRGELILTVYTRGAHSHSVYAGSSFSQYIRGELILTVYLQYPKDLLM